MVPTGAEALVATTPVVVELLDAHEDRVPLDGGSFVVEVVDNPAGVDLVEPVTGTASSGLVAFGPVKLNKPGRNVRLVVRTAQLQVRSDPFEVDPTLPSIIVPATNDELSSCAVVPYTLIQAQSMPVDLLVEFDPDGAGPEPFRPATQAPSAPGAAGVLGVPGRPAGVNRTFTWNTSNDLPAMDAAGELRITPSVRGRAGAPSIRPVRIGNGPRFDEIVANDSPWLATDIDLDGWTDYISISAMAASTSSCGRMAGCGSSIPIRVRRAASRHPSSSSTRSGSC
jgi:hypothetical protein